MLAGWANIRHAKRPSNLHYGFDHWIYGSVDYAARGTAGGEQNSFKQGFLPLPLRGDPVERERRVVILAEGHELNSRQHLGTTLGAVLRREGDRSAAANRLHARPHADPRNRYYGR